MVEFSILSAAAGGALIGAGAVALMLGAGRVAGIAGIADGLLREPLGPDARWRLAFVAGLVTPGLALGLLGRFHGAGIHVALPVLLVAGFLVGFGSRMANGCTSGHGICGLARLSKRSLAAVAVFMAAAGVTVLLMRHVFGG
ncbi:MAG: YeeE/YedE family protein [Solirubrobacterales bacterium]